MTALPGTESIGQDSRAKRALGARLARLYRIHTTTIIVGGQEFFITGVADPDEVLLEMERGIRRSGSEHPRWQPYWARSWDSALAIGQTIFDRHLASCHVLDLGCGLGLAGAVAASKGAHVVLADAAHPALLFARYNGWTWRDRVQTARVDWREDTLAQRFDWIVGADIVYDVHDWPHLDAFWRRHLRPGGEVMLAEPSRDSADELPRFLQSRGWRVMQWQLAMQDRPRPIRLMQCHREDELPSPQAKRL